VFLDVDYRDQTRELNSPVQDAFSERFGDVLHVGEQERLRVQYAVDHIWQLWMAYQKKNERMLSTRAGVLLAYRQKGM
jgi:hypothetical protein